MPPSVGEGADFADFTSEGLQVRGDWDVAVRKPSSYREDD